MSKNPDQYDNSFLLYFSNEMAMAGDKQELAKIIYEKLIESLLIKGFIITFPVQDSEAGRSLFFENAYAGEKTNMWVNFLENFEVGSELADQVFFANSPLMLDIDEIANTLPVRKLGITKIIGSPLKLKDRRIGMLWLFYDGNRSLIKNQYQLLKQISLQIAIAVHYAYSRNISLKAEVNAKIEQQLKEINRYKQQLEEEKLYLQQEVSSGYSFGEIIGSGPEMKEIYEKMSQVAPANSTVLILGETGTGKELIARGIHNASQRKDKLMVKVNCASIPENLIESELFGHEKGAFTGAIERRIGKFELANGGTLFLDEIGEMPIELQGKLLRAIQEKEIERIGGKSVIKVNVRIIAATNRDLLKEVQDGNFRNDLYYRLNVFPITMPPLRNRKDDIPLLVNHFINRFSRNTGKKVNRISSNAMKELVSYEWPGNVRELEHLLERSILISKSEVIKEVHLPSAIDKIVKADSEAIYIKTSVENERDHILFVLKKCNGKIFGKGGAADLLDMHVSTLNSRIKKLGIRKEQIFVVHSQM